LGQTVKKIDDLIVPYGFWTHTATGKENTFLNIASNNFLEGTNYDYLCKPVIFPGKCKINYVMPELRIINSMPDIPSCSTLVALPKR
jgi:hypothetical protein